MPDSAKKMTVMTLKAVIPPPLKNAFIDWQTQLHAKIAAFSGFVSLEILSPSQTGHHEWMIVQRFSASDSLFQWRHSKEFQILLEELKQVLKNDHSLEIEEAHAAHEQKETTEVFVAQVAPGMENLYHEWIAKIHQVEAKFPGFRGIYVESPMEGKGRNWITLLQFDHPDNLDRWLNSKERAEMLRESHFFLTALESHRILSSYSGWFASLAKKGEIPPVWKQTMLVLLVLFPIVMFEIKYLPQFTTHLNPALANFIGNAISVTLIAWPMMPLVIKALNWWLSPKENKIKASTLSLLGTSLICLLYLFEIVLFWNFL
jgi:uncharacterized protein